MNTLVKMARLAGKMNAAATPMRARVPINVAVEWDAAAATEKSPKNTRPTCMVALRPSRSPIPPPARRSPAKAKLYASTIHCSPVIDAPNSRLSVGSATLTIVLSTTTRKTERHRTGRINQRRLCASSMSSAPGVPGVAAVATVAGVSMAVPPSSREDLVMPRDIQRRTPASPTETLVVRCPTVIARCPIVG